MILGSTFPGISNGCSNTAGFPKFYELICASQQPFLKTRWTDLWTGRMRMRMRTRMMMAMMIIIMTMTRMHVGDANDDEIRKATIIIGVTWYLFHIAPMMRRSTERCSRYVHVIPPGSPCGYLLRPPTGRQFHLPWPVKARSRSEMNSDNNLLICGFIWTPNYLQVFWYCVRKFVWQYLTIQIQLYSYACHENTVRICKY